MKSQLEKAINLARVTGDKIIVIDNEKDTGIVVISLDQYQEIIAEKKEEKLDIRSLTEEELLDKINRDIVIWKGENKEKEIETLEEDFLFKKEEKENESEEEKDSEKDENEKEEVDENLYYYDEQQNLSPLVEKESEFVENKNEDLDEDSKKESKNNWQISSEVKSGAEEII